jgi:hypothetical protein
MRMKYNPNENRFLEAEKQRLLRELSNQKMGWRKLGTIFQLNALLRMRSG